MKVQVNLTQGTAVAFLMDQPQVICAKVTQEVFERSRTAAELKPLVNEVRQVKSIKNTHVHPNHAVLCSTPDYYRL